MGYKKRKNRKPRLKIQSMGIVIRGVEKTATKIKQAIDAPPVFPN